MHSNFKRFATLALLFFGCHTAIFGQGNEEKRSTVYVQLKPGLALPIAVGNNFLGKAYDLKPGFLGEARVFFQNRIFLGIHGNFFKADVIDITVVGDFDRTNIWHNYLIGGYALLPRESKVGLDVGVGVGYTINANRRQSIDFHDDGFSTMANVHANYRFSSVIGADLGVQFTKDFLATETAPELEAFFKNANIVYVSAGLVFYINQ